MYGDMFVKMYLIYIFVQSSMAVMILCKDEDVPHSSVYILVKWEAATQHSSVVAFDSRLKSVE